MQYLCIYFSMQNCTRFVRAMYWDFDPSNFRNWLINYSYKIIIYRPLVNIFVDLIENYCEKSPAFALILLYIPSIIFLKNKILNCELYPVLTGPVRTWHPQSACRYLPETFQTHSTHLPDTYHTNHWHHTSFRQPSKILNVLGIAFSSGIN